jgi:phosphocarrier protein HPr
MTTSWFRNGLLSRRFASTAAPATTDGPGVALAHDRETGMAQAEMTVVLTNKMGLHARPSTQIATTASRFASDVHIEKDDMVVDAKSVLELLMLAAECGSQLTIKATGEDAGAAAKAIAELVESRFGELDVDA